MASFPRAPLAGWALTAPLAGWALVALPAAAGAQARETLVVEYADQTQRLAQGDSVSYYLDGNVRARRDDLRLTAQHVVILQWLGVADFSGAVHAWDAEKEIYADHVAYTDSTDVAVATGNVQVVDRASGSELRSQQAVYERAAGRLTATQGPEMLLLPGDGAAPGGGPSLADTAGAEPIHVWGAQIVVERDGDEAYATRDVLIRRGQELTAKADSVRFARAEGRAELRLEPRVETGDFYIQAGEIDVLLPHDRLEGLDARGGARAASNADSIPARAIEALGSPSPNSWIAADSLRLRFDEGTLSTLEAVGGARSLNYSLESESGDAATWALSYLLASRITLHFDESGEGVRRVEASEQGRGIYRTAALAETAPQPEPPAAGAPGDSAREVAAEVADRAAEVPAAPGPAP